jgi:hypothetical protein
VKAPQILKWDKPRGPRWLREVIEKLFRELTMRTPVEGLGVYVDRTENGSVISAGSQPGGRTSAATASADSLPFKMSIGPQDPDTGGDPAKFAVQIVDGKVNNEFPDVGTTTMGEAGGRGFGTLNIADVENSNIFIRVMFNARTLEIVRLDIFERPNETYPANTITFLDPEEEPEPGACDSVDDPATAPPAGYGAIHIALGFTYLQPATPPAEPVATVFQSEIGNINFELVTGAFNGLPALIPAKTYSDWTEVPFE